MSNKLVEAIDQLVLASEDVVINCRNYENDESDAEESVKKFKNALNELCELIPEFKESEVYKREQRFIAIANWQPNQDEQIKFYNPDEEEDDEY